MESFQAPQENEGVVADCSSFKHLTFAPSRLCSPTLSWPSLVAVCAHLTGRRFGGRKSFQAGVLSTLPRWLLTHWVLRRHVAEMLFPGRASPLTGAFTVLHVASEGQVLGIPTP